VPLIDYEPLPRPADARPLCQHCGERPVQRSRGLCSRCYQHKDVRRRYGCTGRGEVMELDACPAPREPPLQDVTPCLWCNPQWRGGAPVLCPGCQAWIDEAKETMP
jgi:hypothetical protein